MYVFVFGLGAVGANVLLQLVKKYPNLHFCGIDYDKVEERNLNTQPYLVHHIGMPKVMAMRTVIGMCRSSFPDYLEHGKKITSTKDVYEMLEPLMDKDKFVVLDCFDNTESRKILNDCQGFIGPRMLHIGFSPQYTAEIIWDRDYSVPGDIPKDQNDICQMSEAVPFIGFVTSFATMVISAFIDNGTKESYIITNKTHIRRL